FVVLLAHVRALLRRGAPPRPTAIEVDDIVLDVGSRTVTRAGLPVDLTRREFAMLEYLAVRPGLVVSRAELIAHVWPAKGADPNPVEVYVGYLRRKLGSGLIETVRGVGYRLGS